MLNRSTSSPRHQFVDNEDPPHTFLKSLTLPSSGNNRVRLIFEGMTSANEESLLAELHRQVSEAKRKAESVDKQVSDLSQALSNVLSSHPPQDLVGAIQIHADEISEQYALVSKIVDQARSFHMLQSSDSARTTFQNIEQSTQRIEELTNSVQKKLQDALNLLDESKKQTGPRSKTEPGNQRDTRSKKTSRKPKTSRVLSAVAGLILLSSIILALLYFTTLIERICQVSPAMCPEPPPAATDSSSIADAPTHMLTPLPEATVTMSNTAIISTNTVIATDNVTTSVTPTSVVTMTPALNTTVAVTTPVPTFTPTITPPTPTLMSEPDTPTPTNTPVTPTNTPITPTATLTSTNTPVTLTALPTTEPTSAPRARVQVTAPSGLNLRNSPSTDAEVVRLLTDGEIVFILGPRETPTPPDTIIWIQVETDRGEVGWISEGATNPLP